MCGIQSRAASSCVLHLIPLPLGHPYPYTAHKCIVSPMAGGKPVGRSVVISSNESRPGHLVLRAICLCLGAYAYRQHDPSGRRRHSAHDEPPARGPVCDERPRRAGFVLVHGWYVGGLGLGLCLSVGSGAEDSEDDSARERGGGVELEARATHRAADPWEKSRSRAGAGTSVNAGVAVGTGRGGSEGDSVPGDEGAVLLHADARVRADLGL
ncbi:hypothetical protein K438DRAFT_1847870 [Mycena galopus ATCC 62051]|nr:hypothetical protein K438DRAFT_1847870 [Mycena galopus ATCC 62051]